MGPSRRFNVRASRAACSASVDVGTLGITFGGLLQVSRPGTLFGERLGVKSGASGQSSVSAAWSAAC